MAWTAFHIDGIDVWAFLAVDLDVDKQRIHDSCCGVVLEGFVGHHMAPVAR